MTYPPTTWRVVAAPGERGGTRVEIELDADALPLGFVLDWARCFGLSGVVVTEIGAVFVRLRDTPTSTPNGRAA
jgi:hypothetical protein